MEDLFIDNFINTEIIQLDDIERQQHISSGKLTASMLGQPLQWQLLKVLGVPDLSPDAYTLRKFLRGKHVEDWYIQRLENSKCLIDKQKNVEYKGVVGIADAIVDSKEWNIKCGVIPHEVKSITNANYKWIHKSRKPGESHQLQAGLYALSLGATHYAIDYIASDDYRVMTMVFEVADIADELEAIISRFNAALSAGELPVFEARYAWQKNPTYASYQPWMLLNAAECEEKLRVEYPDSYNALKGGE